MRLCCFAIPGPSSYSEFKKETAEENEEWAEKGTRPGRTARELRIITISCWVQQQFIF
jgi:hypothetical protein